MPKPRLEPSGLLPVGIHPCSGAEMEAAFVTDLPGSATRPRLINGWRLHRRALSDIVEPQHQWIDGSFVTSKRDPADIDLASFLDGSTVDGLEPHRRHLLTVLTNGKYTRYAWGCDSYLVAVYPPGHPHHAVYQKTRDYWENLFTQTRDGRVKGFVEVDSE